MKTGKTLVELASDGVGEVMRPTQDQLEVLK
jgi:hypothetical protein